MQHGLRKTNLEIERDGVKLVYSLRFVGDGTMRLIVILL